MVFVKSLIALQLLAQAEGGAADPLGGFTSILPLLLMFVVFYFLLIRPASKQRKEHQSMLDALKKNDEVVTTGGIYGRIVTIEDRIVTLEIADKVKIKVLRERISGQWNPTPQKQ